ncbi:hypothetical protein ACA910_008604 [Epithemia clementina (nom. ined.)]
MVPKHRDLVTIMTHSSSLEVTDDENKNYGFEKESEDDQSSCLELYGPYPKAIPVPFLTVTNEGREGTTPASSVLENAKSVFDCPPDIRDVGTPDEWIPRDGRLVRLTGKHPFNVEPPLSILNEFKFITPASLHYVRNHGACPRLTWKEHTVLIGGPLVPVHLELTMDQIAAMPTRELPVTLVCAGNRRKEQNMVRQTIGFSWGPAGVSTNVWKGVMLRDLLLRAGVSVRKMAGKHVEFIGYEDLPNKYGTSIPLFRAMNPAYDVIIAYEANGERLQPDHGFPVRLIIPGYIGGRMVKWLKRINVIPHETKSHYHYHDNRILPPQVPSLEESHKGQWWYKPEYIFNELNINSVITQPNHNDTLVVASRSAKDHYEVAGYAYTGGGRFISRVEVSADGGLCWNVAKIDRKEQPTDYGMYWCWIWFAYDVPIADLDGCQEIWCRAFDDANNLQPDKQTWNLMGMGSNHIFRVKVHAEKTASGDPVYRFEHPTQPGQQTGGWMTRPDAKPLSAGFGPLVETRDVVASESRMPIPSSKLSEERKISYEEVQQNRSEESCWIIIKDKVYDCTEYLDLHPGGIASIVINAGDDATEEFFAIHSLSAAKILEKYYIGDLDKSSVPSNESNAGTQSLEDEMGNKLALHPKKKISLRLQEKIVLSRDSFLLNFALPTEQHILGLPPGKHVYVSATIDGEPVVRQYTPISSNSVDRGNVKFLVKSYKPNARYPRGGKMSQYLDSLKEGDQLEVRGPAGGLEYIGNGKFLIYGKPHFASKFNMIAGGTGITGCFQIASEILRNEQDETSMSLIYACREEGDLLLRNTLDEWAAMYPDKFKVHYILSSKSPSNWKFSTGLVNKSLFQEQLFEPSTDVYNLMCGPPGMIREGCQPNLKSLGHDAASMFSF